MERPADGSIAAEFTLRPYTYRLLESEVIDGKNAVGLYGATRGTRPGYQFFEVHHLRWRKGRVLPGGRSVPAGFARPSNEQWGKYGWTTRKEQSARERYDALCERLRHQRDHVATSTEGTPPDAGDAG